MIAFVRLRRPVVVALVACCTAVGGAGCTAGSSSDAPSGGTAMTVDARSAGPTELGCADAGSGSTPTAPGDLTIAGLTLEGLAGEVRDIPPASRAGLDVPARSDLRFRKAPAHVAAGAGPVTVELAQPTGDQALAWVPATEWTGEGRPDLRRWVTGRVTFDGCPDRDVTYFGGVLADRGDACLHLRIQPTGTPAEEVRLRLDGHPC